MKKSFRVIYFKKYVASIIIAVTVAIVGVVALFGQTSSTYTSNNVVKGVYYSGEQEGKNVSLMINVYWGDEYIGEMLDILKENDVKVTFFLGGTWATNNEETILRMVEDGHELANHGYSHKDCDTLSKEQVRDEITITHDIVKSYAGVDMSLFMPASGAYDTATVDVATECGYKTIMWSKDTIDWRDQDKNLILSRATKNVKGGDLILMHPTLETMNALPEIIEYYQNSDLSLTTVSKNLNSFWVFVLQKNPFMI